MIDQRLPCGAFVVLHASFAKVDGHWRYRDTAISPDGRMLYVATDNGGMLQALAGGATDKVDNPGAILAFTLPGS